MEKQLLNEQNDQFPDSGDEKLSGILGLPLIALGLDLLPVLVITLSRRSLSSFSLLFLIMLPVAGVVTGVFALRRGRGGRYVAGNIISVVAVALPVIFVAIVLTIFIGIVTGVISLM
ncbi:MAG: hypothetical protein FWG28_05700 [Clostridiales bacterium]|nr:hypothetical protein [Clostridiales bacterium]